jgi:hypothetical protein
MKLNSLRGFNAGVVPYSMMTTVFTPIGLMRTPSFKVAASVQEWGGQTYAQANLRQGRYEILSHSYFQNEADRMMEVAAGDKTWLEDEIWAAVRVYPEELPLGEFEAVPGFVAAQLSHWETKAGQAEGTRTAGKDGTAVYKMVYRDIPRELAITYKTEFPHDILAWTETETTPEGKKLVTEAARTHTAMMDYWNRDKPEDLPLRGKLGLKH